MPVTVAVPVVVKPRRIDDGGIPADEFTEDLPPPPVNRLEFVPPPNLGDGTNTETNAETDTETYPETERPKPPLRNADFHIECRDPDPDEQYTEGLEEESVGNGPVPNGKFLCLLELCSKHAQGLTKYGGKGIIDRKAAPPRRAARRIATLKHRIKNDMGMVEKGGKESTDPNEKRARLSKLHRQSFELLQFGMFLPRISNDRPYDF